MSAYKNGHLDDYSSSGSWGLSLVVTMVIVTIMLTMLMLVPSLAFREERNKLALDEERCSLLGG